MNIIEKVSICGYSNKFFMELKFSIRSVSVKCDLQYFIPRSKFQNRNDTYNGYLEDPEVLNNEWLNMLDLQQATDGNGSE